MGIASNGGLRGKLVHFNNVDKHGDIIKSVKGDFGKAPLYQIGRASCRERV